MDVEGPSHRDSLEKAVKLLKENGITLCLSNPAFEVWLLAHFKRVTRSFKDCNAVIVELKKVGRDISKPNTRRTMIRYLASYLHSSIRLWPTPSGFAISIKIRILTNK